MNIFDVIIVLLLILFFISGFKRGIIKETTSLIGLILVFIVSYSLKGVIGSFLCNILPFFKFSGIIEGITSLNILLYQLIAFIIIFSILYGLYEIIVKISNVLQKLLNLTIILWIPSKIAGGILSLIKGYIILFIIFITLMIPLKNQPAFTESSLIDIMINKTPSLSKKTANLTKSINEIYDLGTKVKENKISSSEANTRTLDILLKHKIVDKQTTKKLIEKGKITNINNADDILNRY